MITGSSIRVSETLACNGFAARFSAKGRTLATALRSFARLRERVFRRVATWGGVRPGEHPRRDAFTASSRGSR
jgi:hypothetical protein